MSRAFFVAGLFATVSGCGSGPGSDSDAAASDHDLSASEADLSQAGSDLLEAVDLGGGDDLTGAPCNTLVNSASVVQQVVVNQPMPSATTGGTIVSGTYYLTDSKIYQGSPMSPLKLRMTESISGTTVQTVLALGGNTGGNHDTRMYTTSGTTLTLVFACGSSGTATAGIDATPTQYTTYNYSVKVVNVFTKQ